MKNVCTIYLVRHGRTDWNDSRLIQGHTDRQLTEEGKDTAKQLAKVFKKIKFNSVYSSDLLRAKQTAGIISLEQALGIQSTSSLRERNFGSIEGKPHTSLVEVNNVLENLDEAVRYSYKFNANLEMESDKEVFERMYGFLKKISIANLGKNILVVSHGGPMRILLIKLGFSTYNDLMEIGNLAFMILEYDGKEFKINITSGIEKRNK